MKGIRIILFAAVMLIISSIASVSPNQVLADSRPAVMSGHNGYSQEEMYNAVYKLVSGSHLWWCDNGVLGNRTYPFSELGSDIGFVEYVNPNIDFAFFRRADGAGSYFLHKEHDGCVYLDSLDNNGKMDVQYMRVK